MSLNSSSDFSAFTAAIRAVPDFPEPGIVFRDITPLLADDRLFRQAIRRMAEPFRAAEPDLVVGVESRGFILGAPIALELGAGFIPIRKAGKLPRARRRVEYMLEYGTAALEIHADAVAAGQRVLVVDDVLATGGTARAACDAIEAGQGTVAGLTFLLEIRALEGRKRLEGYLVEALTGF